MNRTRSNRMIVLLFLLANLVVIPMLASVSINPTLKQNADSDQIYAANPVDEINLPIWDEEPTNQTIQFTQSFRYDLNATIPGGGSVWYYMRDWVHFDISEWTGIIRDNNREGPYPYLSAGVYPLVVYAYDIVVYEAIYKLIYIHVVEYDAPIIEGDNPDRTFIEGNVNATLRWNVSEPNWDKLRLYCNDEVVGFYDYEWVEANISIEYEVPDLDPGLYVYRLEATDSVGNSAEDYVAITVSTLRFTPTVTNQPPFSVTSTTTTSNDTNVMHGLTIFILVASFMGLAIIIIVTYHKIR
ncbi:MAG: hypothetical protein GF411_03755 [Candidatus Lokiarchaeota archaeon]|nr:hypothetical protein [Candidatus Lokiarchaeota archaeon]